MRRSKSARTTVLVLFIALLLLPVLASRPTRGASFTWDLEFEVLSPKTRDINATHVDFGLEIKVTNQGKYDDFVYKMNFYIINSSGAYFNSKTVGSFKLYPQMMRVFTINFTMPKQVALEVQTIYYHPPEGNDDDIQFPLIPHAENENDEKDLGTGDIIALIVIGVVFLGTIGLIYLGASYFKKKDRKGKYLKY